MNKTKMIVKYIPIVKWNDSEEEDYDMSHTVKTLYSYPTQQMIENILHEYRKGQMTQGSYMEYIRFEKRYYSIQQDMDGEE